MTKILVIAESTPHRDRLLEALDALGFATLSTERGSRGVQIACQSLPSVILCSKQLAESDGFAVLAMLRKDPTTAIIPSILVAPSLTRSDLRQAMELGADDFLVEPLTSEELVQSIKVQLEKQLTLEEWWNNRNAPPAPPKETSSRLSKPLRSNVTSLAINYPSKPPLDEAFRYIELNYHQSITLGDVAKAVGYSSAYLTNLMRRHTGQTIQQWIIERRMVAARQLLLETDHIVERIAAQVGYQHSVHFFRQFRQLHGTTPQSWRSHNRANL
jgi:AraC-like DNA-binding protein/CheY-like chemotaxis protein